MSVADKVGSKISTWVKVILNKKRCPKCLRPYSDKTVVCEVYESLKTRSTVFAASSSPPVYLRKAPFDRSVCCKTKVQSMEPALCLSISCSCGHSSYIDIPS